jgi:hypothetical protein
MYLNEQQVEEHSLKEEKIMNIWHELWECGIPWKLPAASENSTSFPSFWISFDKVLLQIVMHDSEYNFYLWQ